MGSDQSIQELNQGVVQRNFTVPELAQCHGRDDDTPAYVAIYRKVFDCSRRKEDLYGPTGSYKMFAGRDATRLLAINKLDEEEMDNLNVDDLAKEDDEKSWAWQDYYTERYPCVGWLVVPGEDVEHWKRLGAARLKVLLENEETEKSNEDKEAINAARLVAKVKSRPAQLGSVGEGKSMADIRENHKINTAFLATLMPRVPEDALQTQVDTLKRISVVSTADLAAYTLDDMEKILLPAAARALRPYLKSEETSESEAARMRFRDNLDNDEVTSIEERTIDENGENGEDKCIIS